MWNTWLHSPQTETEACQLDPSVRLGLASPVRVGVCPRWAGRRVWEDPTPTPPPRRLTQRTSIPGRLAVWTTPVISHPANPTHIILFVVVVVLVLGLAVLSGRLSARA